MNDGVDLTVFGAMVVVFVAVTLILGWFGYKNTKNNEEFLLRMARKAHQGTKVDSLEL